MYKLYVCFGLKMTLIKFFYKFYIKKYKFITIFDNIKKYVKVC